MLLGQQLEPNWLPLRRQDKTVVTMHRQGLVLGLHLRTVARRATALWEESDVAGESIPIRPP